MAMPSQALMKFLPSRYGRLSFQETTYNNMSVWHLGQIPLVITVPQVKMGTEILEEGQLITTIVAVIATAGGAGQVSAQGKDHGGDHHHHQAHHRRRHHRTMMMMMMMTTMKMTMTIMIMTKAIKHQG